MITDQRQITFANEHIRRAADISAQNYYLARGLMDQWFAQGLDTLIPNDAKEFVNDGSLSRAQGGTTAPDGRTPITGADIHNIMAVLSQILALAESNNKAALNVVLKAAVNRTGR